MLRDAIADQLNSAVGGVIDTIMKGIWAASVWLLRSVFELVDSFTTLNVVSVDGGIDPTSPIATIWPLMRWVSLVIATGLFFLQLATTMLRGGRGMFRLATGPLAYAIAVGMTAGGIGLLFAAGDGLTTMMLDQGLKADGFVGVLDSPAAAKFFIPAPNLDAPTGPLDPVSPQARAESAGALASQLDATTRAVVLGIVAVFAVIPAGLGLPAGEHLPAGGVRRPGRHLAGHRRGAARRRHRVVVLARSAVGDHRSGAEAGAGPGPDHRGQHAVRSRAA